MWVVTTLASFYLNVFVLVVQAFLRVPALHALAPTQGEPPFAIAQGAVLLGVCRPRRRGAAAGRRLDNTRSLTEARHSWPRT